jgi:hypothetical protein
MGAHGEAASDLRASEIELFDNKKPQSIVYWHADSSAKVPGAMVVVLNLQSAPIKSVAWNETVQAMRRLEPSEYVYFYALTNGSALLPIHPLPEAGGDSAPVNSPWMDRVLPQFESAAKLYQPRKAGVSDFSQFAELASRLADFPGRKSLVCVGCLAMPESLFLDPQEGSVRDGDPNVTAAVQVFLQARVATYVVVGLEKSRFPESMPAGSNNVQSTVIFENQVDGFSAATGGRAYRYGEIAQAIAEAAHDSRAAYRLAYLPDTGNWDGNRHALKMVCRRNGVRVLAPLWYKAENLEDVERELHPPIPQWVIQDPFDQPDIAISISSAGKTANGVRILVGVNAADVLLLPREGRYTGSLRLQALCYSADGRKQACTEPMRADLDLSEAEHQTALREGMKFPIGLPAGSADSKIRMVVHDPNSGASGSHTFRLGEVH